MNKLLNNFGAIHCRSTFKVPSILSDIDQNWSISTNFSKNYLMQSSIKMFICSRVVVPHVQANKPI